MVIYNKIKSRKEDSLALAVLGASGLYLIIIALISKGLYGDTDSVSHYQIARYAFRYPALLVDHWGKPLFTILCAPFAQAGFTGAMIFNILCGLATSWLIYKMARHYKLRYAILAIPFTLFSPTYMVNMFTSLTEILFSLVLVLSIYCFLKKKFILSAIVISFIPFARTEGMMFLPLFLVAFILVRKYKALPFLLSGFVFFSLAGYLRYKTLLWFFTAIPYNVSGEAVYGSGSFWYYLERFHHLLGLPLTILGGIGLILLIIRLFRGGRPVMDVDWVVQYFLVICAFFGFLLTHSFLWWKGLMGVLASPRFMACILPLGSYFAVVGFDGLLALADRRKWISITLVLMILGLVIWVPYTLDEIPSKLSRENEVMKATAAAVRKIGYKDREIRYFDPKFVFYLGEDPFGRLNCFAPMKMDRTDFGLPERSLVIWDTHFGEFERNITFSSMINNPSFRIVDGFYPTGDFKFFNGLHYMSYIFERIPVGTKDQTWQLVDSISFESANNEEALKYLTDSVHYSGNKSEKLQEGHIYSQSIHKNLSEIGSSQKVIIRATAQIMALSKDNFDQVHLVISVHDASGKMVRYLIMSGPYFKPKLNDWCEMTLISPLYTEIPVGGNLKLYIWHQGKSAIYVDDLVLKYIPVNNY
jgi:hypothetical protein